MQNSIIFCVMLISTTVLAASAPKSIEQYIQERTETTCDKHIRYYNERLTEIPSDRYYRYMLKRWTERCTPKPVTR